MNPARVASRAGCERRCKEDAAPPFDGCRLRTTEARCRISVERESRHRTGPTMMRACGFILLLGAFPPSPAHRDAREPGADRAGRPLEGDARWIPASPSADRRSVAGRAVWSRDPSSREAGDGTFRRDGPRPWWPRTAPAGPPDCAGRSWRVRRGLLLEPRGAVLGRVIALPDADQTPGKSPASSGRPGRIPVRPAAGANGFPSWSDPHQRGIECSEDPRIA
jgi:hypothetical protein